MSNKHLVKEIIKNKFTCYYTGKHSSCYRYNRNPKIHLTIYYTTNGHKLWIGDGICVGSFIEPINFIGKFK